MVEQHSAMRFAWLRSKDGVEEAPELSPAGRVLLVAYNAVWWIPMVLAIFGVVSSRAAFIAFLVITLCRAAINLYRNNVMPVETAQRFPLRLP